MQHRALPLRRNSERSLKAAQDDPSAAWVEIFRELGFPAYPVRVDGDMVCIMAPAADCPRLLEETIREPLIQHGKALGYRFITLDIGHLVE